MAVGQIEGKKPRVSVIVPIYGVEQFIGRCAESLMRQTLRNAEFLFVDDATRDRSVEVLRGVLQKYPARAEQVRVLRHEANQGLPAARNTGLAAARGTYVFHCDGDDFVESDMLEKLCEAAEQADADIVWCDFYLTFGQNERYMRQPAYGTPAEALKGLLGGAMKYNVWNKLVRRSLYVDNRIAFPAGCGMGEDMTMIRLFACAGRVVYVPGAFYHYVKTNVGSFCQTYSGRHLTELRENVRLTVDFLEARFPHDLTEDVAFLKLQVKFPFLISDGRNGWYRLWTTWYPEANRFIWRDRHMPLRSRMVQWCAWRRQFWLVWLYYQVVMRFVYGVLYR